MCVSNNRVLFVPSVEGGRAVRAKQVGADVPTVAPPSALAEAQRTQRQPKGALVHIPHGPALAAHKFPKVTVELRGNGTSRAPGLELVLVHPGVEGLGEGHGRKLLGRHAAANLPESLELWPLEHSTHYLETAVDESFREGFEPRWMSCRRNRTFVPHRVPAAPTLRWIERAVVHGARPMAIRTSAMTNAFTSTIAGKTTMKKKSRNLGLLHEFTASPDIHQSQTRPAPASSSFSSPQPQSEPAPASEPPEPVAPSTSRTTPPDAR